MKNNYNKIYGSCGIWEDFNKECIRGKEVKLRYCKATVGITDSGEFTYLRSYDTIVCN